MPSDTTAGPAAYSRKLLECWRAATEWRPLALAWLDQLVERYGIERFRTRKGNAKHDVKELCEEVLPLGTWMAGCSEVQAWEAKFSNRYSSADAWVRMSPSSTGIPVQIVGAFDGFEFADQMKDLNARGRTATIVKSKTEIEESHSQLVERAIEKKKALPYQPGFWLLVAIDDRFIRLSELPSVIERAREFSNGSQFAQVHLVGMIGQEAIRVR